MSRRPAGGPFYPAGEGNRRTRYKWTGEFRPPKAGEWYLSGAIIEAWRAPNDLTTAFYIAKPVQTRLVEVEVTS